MTIPTHSPQYIQQQTYQFKAQPPQMGPPQYASQQFGAPPAYQPPLAGYQPPPYPMQ